MQETRQTYTRKGSIDHHLQVITMITRVTGSPDWHSVFLLKTLGSMFKYAANLLLHVTLSSHWPPGVCFEYVVQVLQPVSHLVCARGHTRAIDRS